MPELDAETLDAAATADDLSPTDAEILAVLDEGRNVPANITDEIDRNPGHVSNRIASLRDRGLVAHVGRESVSLYEITERGKHAYDAYRQLQSALQG